jgi:hypothetical protein
MTHNFVDIGKLAEADLTRDGRFNDADVQLYKSILPDYQDVSGDGVVSLVDYQSVRETHFRKIAADLNSDGSVDAYDIDYLLQWVGEESFRRG